MPSTETISNNTHPSSGDNSIENFHSPSTTTTTTTTTTSNNTTTSITSASPTAAGGCNHITTTSSHHHDLQADEYSSPSSPPSPLSSSGGSTGLQQVWATHGSQALWKYKLNDLKNELKIKGLNVTGNKPNIINRLHSQYMAELSQQQQQQNGGSQFVSPQQQQSSSSLDDHGDKSEQTPSSCSPPSSPTTTTVSTTVAAVAATSTTTSVASTLTNNNNNSSGTPATTVAASTTTTTGMTTLPSKVTTIAPQTHVVKPPSRLPPFMPMSSIHSAAAGGSFYPTMPIAPPSRPKILVKPPSVIIPPPPAPSSSSSTALNARNAASLATAATTTTTEKSSVGMNGVGSGSVLPRNPTISAPTANTASLTTATSLQKTSSLSARRRMAQKGVSVKSNKPAVSASAAVLMQMTDTPMSPQAPKTRLSALKAKPPSIIMPKPMTPLSDQSKYMTFSPHSSAQFLPFQNSSSSISRALKRKAGTRLPQFSSSSSHLLSSSTTGKPSKMMVAAKKVMMKSSSSSADQNQQIKKRGRPSHKGKTLSQDHIPSDLISLGPSRSSSISSYGMVKTIDYGSTSGIGSHHHHYHNTSPIRSRNEDSQNTDSESESDMDNCLDYLVGSDDENYTMSSHNDSSTSYQASESVATTAPDCLDSIVPTREVNLIEDYIENVPNRKRALLDDTDFYGDVSYSTDASPYKRRKSDDVFGGAEEEEEDEEFDEEPFFFCGTTQEVPESIAESNLMEQTMGALQSEYSFEVSLAKNMTSSETTSVSILSTLIEDDSETRKLSVGGNITLHELTKSILELFTYDRYGGLDNGLGIDSDSRYTMSLPYGIELSNPDANSQSGKSSEDLRVAGAKLGDRDTFYITFPCADDLSKTYCKFSIRVENIAITSSNDDTDILLTDEDNDSNLLGSILSDSYLNSYDGDNDSDDAPSEEDNATQSGDDMLNLLDSNLLLSI